MSATGGGNIGVFSVANITVSSNDGPYGVVAFSASTAATTEVGDNGTSIAILTIFRRHVYTYIMGIIEYILTDHDIQHW